MPVTAAQAKATAKYEQKAYDKILVRIGKGTRDRWKSAAAARGVSLNQLIVDSVEAAIKDRE